MIFLKKDLQKIFMKNVYTLEDLNWDDYFLYFS
jgi:hypothetical protein